MAQGRSDEAQRTTPDSLPLDSLEITNFRAFRHLTMEKLGRVNLIIGKNNVGKSSLLEAIHIYAERGTSSFLRSLLQDRAEFDSEEVDDDALLFSYMALLHGYPQKGYSAGTAIIGQVRSPEKLTIGVQSSGTLRIGWNNADPIQVPLSVAHTEASFTRLDVPTIKCRRLRSHDFDRVHWKQWLRGTDHDGAFLGFVSRRYLIPPRMEQEIIGALHIIDPRVTGLDYQQPTATRTGVNIEFDALELLPLESLGEGSLRLLGFAAAFYDLNNGILLIDEIENGLHYSVLTDVWRLIFARAHQLNFQVFATTHSWDCIEAFQQAAAEADHPASGVLIRLQRQGDEVTPTVFDKFGLEVITRRGIEVR